MDNNQHGKDFERIQAGNLTNTEVGRIVIVKHRTAAGVRITHEGILRKVLHENITSTLYLGTLDTMDSDLHVVQCEHFSQEIIVLPWSGLSGD